MTTLFIISAFVLGFLVGRVSKRTPKLWEEHLLDKFWERNEKP